MMSQLLNFSIENRDKGVIGRQGKKHWDSMKFAEFNALDVTLQSIVLYAVFVACARFGRATIITSMYRASGGVHALFRGCDIDVDHKVKYGGLTPAEAGFIVDEINSIYQYDPDRPDFKVAVYNLTGEKARKFGPHITHIHFQSKPGKTVFVG